MMLAKQTASAAASRKASGATGGCGRTVWLVAGAARRFFEEMEDL